MAYRKNMVDCHIWKQPVFQQNYLVESVRYNVVIRILLWPQYWISLGRAVHFLTMVTISCASFREYCKINQKTPFLLMSIKQLIHSLIVKLLAWSAQVPIFLRVDGCIFSLVIVPQCWVQAGHVQLIQTAALWATLCSALIAKCLFPLNNDPGKWNCSGHFNEVQVKSSDWLMPFLSQQHLSTSPELENPSRITLLRTTVSLFGMMRNWKSKSWHSSPPEAIITMLTV